MAMKPSSRYADPKGWTPEMHEIVSKMTDDKMVKDLASDVISASDRSRLAKEIYDGMIAEDQRFYNLYAALACRVMDEVDLDKLPESPASRHELLPYQTLVYIPGKTGFERTSGFLRQINSLRGNIVDAGAGATAIFSFAAAMADQSNTVTGIECSPYSHAAANIMLRRLAVDPERAEVLLQDATTWIPDFEIDGLISETLTHALTDEPLMEIMAHLNQFLSERGVCVPAGVELLACIFDGDGSKAATNFNHFQTIMCRDAVAGQMVTGQIREAVAFDFERMLQVKVACNLINADGSYLLEGNPVRDVINGITGRRTIVTSTKNRELSGLEKAQGRMLVEVDFAYPAGIKHRRLIKSTNSKYATKAEGDLEVDPRVRVDVRLKEIDLETA